MVREPHVSATRSEAFAHVIDPAARIELLAEVDAHEGPVFIAGMESLFVTTTDHKRIMRVNVDKGHVDLLVDNANMVNGMCLDPNGNLLVCEMGSMDAPARISRVDPTSGESETVVDSWQDRPLNSPNDVVCPTDGSIWFTDPCYRSALGFGPPPAEFNDVYRLDPETSELRVMVDSMNIPNGLAFSPNEEILYVTDTSADPALPPDMFRFNRQHHILAFDVIRSPDRLVNQRLFAAVTPGIPDGIKLDVEGRVYTGTGDGVQVFDPDGLLLGTIGLGTTCANFTFGGSDNSRLFMLTDTAIYTTDLHTSGIAASAPRGTRDQGLGCG